MATVRAQRLLNNIINGTTNSTALETALATSSVRADFQQIINERSRARTIFATDNGAAAVGQSVTAVADFFDSRIMNAEYAKNSTKMNNYIGSTVASNNALMGAFTNFTSNLTIAASTKAVGGPIYTSSFAGNYSSRFISGSSASSKWNLPAMSAFNGVGGGGQRFFAVNGSTIVMSEPNHQFNHADAIAVSTNGGTSWTNVQVDASAAITIFDVAYGDGVYVLIGNSTASIYTSTNATTWTKVTSFTTVGTPRKITYENGRFIMITDSFVYYSTNGTSWSAASGHSGSSHYALEYVGNNTWIALWNSTNILRSTNNGNSWSAIGTGTTNYCVASDGAGRVAVGTTSGAYYYSNNYGQTWTNGGAVSGLSTSWAIYGAAYYGGNFLFGNYAVGNIGYVPSFGSSLALTGGAAGGINPVPNYAAYNAPHSLIVRDGRLISIISSSATATYVGQ